MKTMILSVLLLFASYLASFAGGESNMDEDYTLLAPSDIRILLFNNIDTHKNFVDSAYAIYIKDNPLYSEKFASEPFSDATFTKYNNLAKIDLVIIPMGDRDLSYTSGSRSVISTIRQLIKQGKKVLITSRSVLSQAFTDGKGANLGVRRFLEDTLGIDFIKYLPVSKQEGNTLYWWSFVIRGAENDPIGMSIHKYCNQGWGPDNWVPLAQYLGVDVFKSKDKTKFFPTDHFIRENNDIRNDTIVGIRAEYGDSRIAFWSMGFEAFAGDIPRSTLMERAMAWLLENIPVEGPQIKLNVENIDFGHIKLETTAEQTFQIKNVGTEPLDITETSFFTNDDEVFGIKSGEIKPSDPGITLNTGETYDITVTFSPKEKKLYEGSLTISSNSMSGNMLDLNLSGYGGDEEISGPKLTLNFENNMIDMGQVKPGETKEINLDITNTGANELSINTFTISQNDDEAFGFAQVVSTPFFVQPGQTRTIAVKFGARPEERIYNGKIHIESNDAAHSDFYIDLKMEVNSGTGVAETGRNEAVISITPNPVKDMLTLDYSVENTAGSLDVFIVDMSGRRVKDIFSGVSSGSFRQEVSVSDIAPGLYFIIARSGNIESRAKMIKEGK